MPIGLLLWVQFFLSWGISGLMGCFLLRAREDSAPASRLQGKTSLSAAQENLHPFAFRANPAGASEREAGAPPQRGKSGDAIHPYFCPPEGGLVSRPSLLRILVSLPILDWASRG